MRLKKKIKYNIEFIQFTIMIAFIGFFLMVATVLRYSLMILVKAIEVGEVKAEIWLDEKGITKEERLSTM